MKRYIAVMALSLLVSGCGLDLPVSLLQSLPAVEAQSTTPAIEAARKAIRRAIEKKAPDYDLRLFWLRVVPVEDGEFDFQGNGVITDHREQTRFKVWGYYNPKIDKVDFELTKTR